MGTTTAIWQTPSAASFTEARELGIPYVEVALNQCYRNVPPEEVVPRVHTLKSQLDSAGLKVWSIHLPYSNTLDISVTDPVARKENVAFMAGMIQLSALFNPAKLVLHPSSEPIADSIREERIRNAIESIGILAPYAREIHAQLCIENLPRTCLGNTPEELLRIIEAYPEVGICFDTNHYLTGTPARFAEVAGSRIATVHLSDYDGINESHWIPGEGVIDWKELFGILTRNGYSGVYMYEAMRNKEGERATPQQLAQSFHQLKPTHEK